MYFGWENLKLIVISFLDIWNLEPLPCKKDALCVLILKSLSPRHECAVYK